MATKRLKPQLVVLSSPSGGGKTTICKMLAEQNPDFRISVSATTRKPRHNEKDATDYFFISQREFFQRVGNKEFLEFEEVHGHYYGTLKSTVKDLLDRGFTVLFDIDVNGAMSIKKHYNKAILIFIQPPSLTELKKRLRARKTDSEYNIERRLKRLPVEYSKAEFFDYDIVNENLDKTVSEIHKIIREHQQEEAHVSN
jgi:guanylate kinase